MKPSIAVLAVTVAVFTLAASNAFSEALPKSEYPALIKSMDDTLLDSQSARIKNVEIFRSKSKGDVVCGMLNAKNSFGAYVGYRPFMAMRLRADLFYFFGADEVMATTCKEARKAHESEAIHKSGSPG